MFSLLFIFSCVVVNFVISFSAVDCIEAVTHGTSQGHQILLTYSDVYVDVWLVVLLCASTHRRTWWCSALSWRPRATVCTKRIISRPL